MFEALQNRPAPLSRLGSGLGFGNPFHRGMQILATLFECLYNLNLLFGCHQMESTTAGGGDRRRHLDKGVIHRDLKPANIMLDGRGHVRITDFASAGVAAQIRDVRRGTPEYMSPEQAAGKEVTPRSDIYGLGICSAN